MPGSTLSVSGIPASDNSAQLSLIVIQEAVAVAAQYLPSQGPITAFTMLNPMAAMEDLSFDDALQKVPEIFGCKSWLPESDYRRLLKQGRIREQDLYDVLRELSHHRSENRVAGLIDRTDFRLTVLRNPVLSGDDAELHWILMESDVLSRFRPEASEQVCTELLANCRHWVASMPPGIQDPQVADIVAQVHAGSGQTDEWEAACLRLMWRYSCIGVQQVRPVRIPASKSVRFHDLLKQATGRNADDLVHDVLIPFCASYLDQGFAEWSLPGRDSGFLKAFCDLFQSAKFLQRPWLRGLPEELRRMQSRYSSATEWVRASLEDLGVTPETLNDSIRAGLLALRGYAGMLWQTEVRPDRVHLPSPPGTLMEFLAVRFVLDRLAVRFLARTTLNWKASLNLLSKHLRSQLPDFQTRSSQHYAFRIFQCAQLNGWGPSVLAGLSSEAWQELVDELAEFSQHQRQRVFHAAFERRYACDAMDAVIARVSQPPRKPVTPLLQVTCCIDAREESFRRHIEEVSEDVQTFGVAGFYGIPMYYRGLGDADFTGLCPAVVKPCYWVTEESVYSMEEVARAKARARRMLGSATHRILGETTHSIGGAFVSALLGPLATAPLLGYTVFPGLTARLRRVARHFVAPPQVSRLQMDRDEFQEPGPGEGQTGFTVAEMAQLGGKLLRDIGLTKDFAPIVLFLGHGSSCMNNPHTSAYHCGACSGGTGGPNARAMATMLNDRRVRRVLSEQGLRIPDETHMLSGMHNTGTDEIMFYDLELLPGQHTRHMHKIRDILRQACERNAQERCRRFESADFDIAAGPAMLHVQDRSQNLAETRPEYGNCTNAMCLIARRDRVRGLFMDRRAFLQSYDPTADDAESSILAGILSAVIPVCEGINLLYTLSAIDPSGWGAGSKLPHNATSMLGVMDGAASDLRVGLPWQGVDIHEPMRLLCIVETTPETMLDIMNRNPVIGRICRGGWVRLAVLNPDSPEILTFTDGIFQPYVPRSLTMPTTPSSVHWYRGSRDNLPFAIIDPKVQ